MILNICVGFKRLQKPLSCIYELVRNIWPEAVAAFVFCDYAN